MEKAVGFVPLNIMPGEGDAIAHAELKLDSSMYMVSPLSREIFAQMVNISATVWTLV